MNVSLTLARQAHVVFRFFGAICFVPAAGRFFGPPPALLMSVLLQPGSSSAAGRIFGRGPNLTIRSPAGDAGRFFNGCPNLTIWSPDGDVDRSSGEYSVWVDPGGLNALFLTEVTGGGSIRAELSALFLSARNLAVDLCVCVRCVW